MRNDAVIICAGGVLPTAFLAEIGVLVETMHGTPMRTNA
jgi:thioredoxin reductase (NADPH)